VTLRDSIRKENDGEDPGAGSRTDRGRRDEREMFEAASRSTEMAAPVAATLNPLSAPERTYEYTHGSAGASGKAPSLDDMVVGDRTAGSDDSPMDVLEVQDNVVFGGDF